METRTAIEGFNLYRMLFGSSLSFFVLAEIALRTGIMYLYTLFNIRLFKTRNVAQLTLSDLIIVIALGTAVGDPMMYIHVPLIEAMISITTIVMLTKAISVLVENYNFIEKMVEGEEITIIKNGEILKENMHKASLSQDELFGRLRLNGIQNTGEITYAFLETSGLLSIIKAKVPSEGISTLNHLDKI